MVDVKFRPEIQPDLSRVPTITNGGATITSVQGGGGWDIFKTSKVFSAGLIYAEITVGAIGSGVIVGLALPHANVYGFYLGQGNIEGIGWQNNGSVLNSGMGGVSGGSYSAASVLRLCVNLTTSKYWVAVGAGLWNNDAGADPVAGTNGGDLSTLFTNKKMFVFAASAAVGGSVTINGGNYASFIYSVPSGYTAADSATGKEMWNFSSVTYGTVIDAFNTGSNVSFIDQCFVHGGASNNTWNTALCTKPIGTGSKVYFEVYVATRGNYIDVGFAGYNVDYTSYPGNTASVGWAAFGSANGPGMVTAGAYSGNVGTILRICIDYDNKRIWVALGDGPWNGNATYDPTTNVGGGDMTTFIASCYNNIIYPCIGVGNANDYARCNFGALSDFVYGVPSGFVSVDAATAASVVSNLRLTKSMMEVALQNITNVRITKVHMEDAATYPSIFYMSQIRMEVAVQMANPNIGNGTQGFFVT